MVGDEVEVLWKGKNHMTLSHIDPSPPPSSTPVVVACESQNSTTAETTENIHMEIVEDPAKTQKVDKEEEPDDDYLAMVGCSREKIAQIRKEEKQVVVVEEEEEEEEVEVEVEVEEEEKMEAQEDAKKKEIPTEVPLEEEEEEEEEEEDDDEVFEIVIQGKSYYTTNEVSGKIYAIDKDDEVGDEIGVFVNSKPTFYKNKK